MPTPDKDRICNKQRSDISREENKRRLEQILTSISYSGKYHAEICQTIDHLVNSKYGCDQNRMEWWRTWYSRLAYCRGFAPDMIQKRAYTTAYKLVFVSYGVLVYSFQLAAFCLSVTNVQ